MPLLNGPRVRHRAAALGWDLGTLAKRSGVPLRAVQNCTRAQHPQPMKLTRIYALGRTLAEAAAEDEWVVTAEIVDDAGLAAEILTARDDPKKGLNRESTGPTRRQGTEKTTGPKRATATKAAA